MPSILSSALSKPIVTIAFASGVRALRGVKVKRVIGQFSSTMPRHMMEDGSSVSDVRILRAATISMDVICPTIDDAEDVIAMMNDRSSLYTITSKGVVYRNFMAQSISVKQSAEMLTAAPFRMYLKQFMLENVSPVTVAQDADSNLLDGGIQLLTGTSQTITGLYTKISNSAVNAVSNLFGG